ncbi:gamma-type small acid-soluble spore protein [Peribacillus sp. SCS-155]|uniref:gamma-type small acid-soluble spore protein n=1 Tax=Peribacillus sedimenti TaxID=3115297 RepID=UPI0039069058
MMAKNYNNITQTGTNIQQVRQQNQQALAGQSQFGTEFGTQFGRVSNERQTDVQEVRRQNQQAAAQSPQRVGGQFGTEFGSQFGTAGMTQAGSFGAGLTQGSQFGTEFGSQFGVSNERQTDVQEVRRQNQQAAAQSPQRVGGQFGTEFGSQFGAAGMTQAGSFGAGLTQGSQFGTEFGSQFGVSNERQTDVQEVRRQNQQAAAQSPQRVGGQFGTEFGSQFGAAGMAGMTQAGSFGAGLTQGSQFGTEFGSQFGVSNERQTDVQEVRRQNQQATAQSPQRVGGQFGTEFGSQFGAAGMAGMTQAGSFGAGLTQGSQFGTEFGSQFGVSNERQTDVQEVRRQNQQATAQSPQRVGGQFGTEFASQFGTAGMTQAGSFGAGLTQGSQFGTEFGSQFGVSNERQTDVQEVRRQNQQAAAQSPQRVGGQFGTEFGSQFGTAGMAGMTQAGSFGAGLTQGSQFGTEFGSQFGVSNERQTDVQEVRRQNQQAAAQSPQRVGGQFGTEFGSQFGAAGMSGMTQAAGSFGAGLTQGSQFGTEFGSQFGVSNERQTDVQEVRRQNQQAAAQSPQRVGGQFGTEFGSQFGVAGMAGMTQAGSFGAGLTQGSQFGTEFGSQFGGVSNERQTDVQEVRRQNQQAAAQSPQRVAGQFGTEFASQFGAAGMSGGGGSTGSMS